MKLHQWLIRIVVALYLSLAASQHVETELELVQIVSKPQITPKI